VAAIAELIEGFAFAHMGRAPARFDPAELTQLNAKTLHLLPYEAVRERLPEGISEAAWLAIRPNLTTLADAAEGWAMIEGPVPAPAFEAEDRAFCARAAAIAETLDWSADPWGQLVGALKAETGRKGRALFLPLRQALTGRDHGPEMAALLPLIGRDRAVARLSA
jgi:glutamyl-tRNA synthetase